MAIISSNCYADKPVVELDTTSAKTPCITITCGDAHLFIYVDEAGELRDDLSRAITEAATAAAEAVQAEGAAT